MTTYEIIMIMLTCLTLIISLFSLVVRLLLIIIDKNAKKQLPRSLVKFEVVIY
ncbi:putative holin-like toxin [Catenibacterium mitsuokai]|uniref:putative holin-like toxin n=1 Tax=Catenibacterium faecis TaxID=2764323 RepID=UPI003D76D732